MLTLWKRGDIIFISNAKEVLHKWYQTKFSLLLFSFETI